jgi:hypothetical protein
MALERAKAYALLLGCGLCLASCASRSFAVLEGMDRSPEVANSATLIPLDNARWSKGRDLTDSIITDGVEFWPEGLPTRWYRQIGYLTDVRTGVIGGDPFRDRKFAQRVRSVGGHGARKFHQQKRTVWMMGVPMQQTMTTVLVFVYEEPPPLRIKP